MMDYAIPPGTIVATSAWSMHPDLSVFASPDTFLPERWLKSSSTSDHLLGPVRECAGVIILLK